MFCLKKMSLGQPGLVNTFRAVYCVLDQLLHGNKAKRLVKSVRAFAVFVFFSLGNKTFVLHCFDRPR